MDDGVVLDSTRLPAAPRVPGLVAEALLAYDVPASDAAQRRAAARYVDDSVAVMPDVTRAGVRVASTLVYGALSAMAGRPYRRLPERRRAVLAARLARLPLPLVAEFGRLTRGLGLVGYVERTMPVDAHEPAGGPAR
jgi:hypothetical protein